MSLTSDSSPVPSPAESTASEQSSASTASSLSDVSDLNKRPLTQSYPEYYGEKRRRRESDNADNVRRIPKATHKPHYNEQLQGQVGGFLSFNWDWMIGTFSFQFEVAVAGGSEEDLDRLLSHHSEKIDINRYGCDGRTPLQDLCSRGMLPHVKLLVAYGADTRRRTREGWSTLHIAAFSGNTELLSYILQCNGRTQPR